MIGQHMITRRLLFRTGRGKKRNPLNAVEIGPEDAPDYKRPENGVIVARYGQHLPYPIEECFKGVDSGRYEYLGYKGNHREINHYFRVIPGRHRG